MANKASAITGKNRGLTQDAITNIGKFTGKRGVHEIHVENI